MEKFAENVKLLPGVPTVVAVRLIPPLNAPFSRADTSALLALLLLSYSAWPDVAVPLIAAIILFFMGSGPIKGFSVTLGVGIFTTLFSVYFIARLFTSIYVAKNKDKERLI